MSIVCGIDFSPLSHAALRCAAALAFRLDQELWLVHALAPDSKANERELKPALTHAVHRLDELRATLGHRAMRVKTEADVGAPSEVLSRAAEKHHASMLVVGSAGHADRPLGPLGGTSERLAAHAAMPVVVVRDTSSVDRWAREGAIRVMIGVDDSQASAAAVRWVERLRSTGPVDVVLGHIAYADEAAKRYGVPNTNPLETSNEQVEALLARELRQRFPSLRGQGEVFYRVRLGVGRMGDHLAALAEAEDCQLLVVGTHGKQGIARWWSVSAAALHVARIAVAVVPSGAEPATSRAPRLRHVLVTTDFSACGDAAVPWAYGLVAPGGTVTRGHVVGPSEVRREPWSELGLASKLRSISGGEDDRIVTNIELISGDQPAAAIAQAAARLGVDAIVMASHGHTGLRRTALGSVTDEVLRTSETPVFVVRPKP